MRAGRWAGLAGAFLALLLLAGLAAAEPIRLQQIDITGLPRVVVYFTVVDAGGEPVLGLSERELQVLIDGVAQAPLALESALDGGERLAVALLFDRSGSMRPALERSKEAALDLVGRLSVGDQAAVVEFDDEVRVACELTSDRQRLAAAIAGVGPGRNTALYDAGSRAVEMLSASSSRRRAAILFSDGRDTRSATTRQELLAAATAAGVPFYAIGLADTSDLDSLSDLARATGGELFEAGGPGDLLVLYQQIAERLNNQYRVSFDSSFGADESWHQLEVVTTGAAADLGRARREFLASTGPGVSRDLMGGMRRSAERRGVALQAGLGGLAGLLLALAVLVLLGSWRGAPGLLSLPALGFVLSATIFGALVGALAALLQPL